MFCQKQIKSGLLIFLTIQNEQFSTLLLEFHNTQNFTFTPEINLALFLIFRFASFL